MSSIDGEKCERVVVEVYKIFQKNHVSGNEASAIAGMLLSTASAFQVSESQRKEGEG